MTLSEDQLSPWTHCPRSSCPPGHLVLGLDVPCQDGLSPLHNLAMEFNMEMLVDHGVMELKYNHIYNYVAFRRYPTTSNYQCYIIRHKCIEPFRME